MSNTQITAILIDGTDSSYGEIHIEHLTVPAEVITHKDESGGTDRFRFHGECLPFDPDVWIYEWEDPTERRR